MSSQPDSRLAACTDAARLRFISALVMVVVVLLLAYEAQNPERSRSEAVALLRSECQIRSRIACCDQPQRHSVQFAVA